MASGDLLPRFPLHRLRVAAPVAATAGAAGFGAACGLVSGRAPLIALALSLAVCAAVAMIAEPVIALAAYVLVVSLRLSEDAVDIYGLPGMAHPLAAFILVLGIIAARRAHGAPVASRVVAALVVLFVTAGFASALVADDANAALRVGTHALGDAAVASVVTLLVRTPRHLRVALWALTCGGLFSGCLALYQHVTKDFASSFAGLARPNQTTIVGTLTGFRPGGQFGDPNFFARSEVVVLPLAIVLGAWVWSRRARVVAWAAGGVAVATVVLSASRGGLVALLLVLGIAVAQFRPRVSMTLVVAGIAVVAAALLPSSYFARVASVAAGTSSSRTDPSVRERAHGLETATRMTVAHPVLGVGLGNYQDHAAQFAPSASTTEPREALPPHSLYLATTAETGVIGLLALGAAVAVPLLGTRRLRRHPDPELADLARGLELALLGFFAASAFLPPAYSSQMWLLLALAASAWNFVETKPPLHLVRPARTEAPT